MRSADKVFVIVLCLCIEIFRRTIPWQFGLADAVFGGFGCKKR
ncbi:hypothetical protein l13_19880 [Neisseria weaveri ATCC 51223]|nr:hypothetical protein l13_19880 [Neisseria weaveri ATCC 51223]